MKFKRLLGIFFVLALITTTVFGFSAENSRQGFDRNSTDLHQGFTLSKAASAPGFLACFLDSSRQAFLLGQSGNQKGVGGKGWRGNDPTWKNWIKRIKQGGDVETPTIPSKQEALDLLKEAGAKVLRIEEHLPGGNSPHTYPHINYVTSSGLKGTLRILGL